MTLTKKFSQKKNLIAGVMFAGLAAAAVASSTDNLGLSTVWTTIQSWVQDGYLTKIFGLIFFAVGIQRAFMGSILQFFLMLGMSLLVVNADGIMGTVFSAIV